MNEALYHLLTSFPTEVVDEADERLHAYIPFRTLYTNYYEDDTNGNYVPAPFRLTAPSGTYLIRIT